MNRSDVDRGGLGGHPRGLTTLFFTELWERFSYYGMRALLILFMVAGAERGGLGFDVKRAASIYGLYTSAVYFMAIPGGWIADRLLGQRRAVLCGGILIALGHFSLAVDTLPTFFAGLVLIANEASGGRFGDGRRTVNWRRCVRHGRRPFRLGWCLRHLQRSCSGSNAHRHVGRPTHCNAFLGRGERVR